MPDLAFPLVFDSLGRTATADSPAHIRQMIELFLFTSPGERVNRPDFGSGLLHMVFGPNSPEIAGALQFTVQAGLQRWLGDVITVDALSVTAEDATLRVELSYTVLRTGERRREQFERAAA